MALKPPKPKTLQAEAPAPAPEQEVAKAAPPKRRAPPKAAVAKKEAVAKAKGEPVAKAKRTPKKESAPKAEKPTKVPVAKAGPKAAVEPAIPEVPPIESEHFSGPQIEFGNIVQAMRDSSIADTRGRLEIRYVTPRASVLLNKKIKVPARGCYTRVEEVDQILDFFRMVPAEFVPAKWERFLRPVKAPAKKAKAEKPAAPAAPKAKRTKK